MENDKTTITERQENDKQALIDALKEMPIARVACKRAGVSRATYYRWRNEDKNFLQQCYEAISIGIEAINEMSDSQLISLIGEKSLQAIKWWQQHNHERYGAKVRQNPASIALENLDPDDPKSQKIREITQRYEDELRSELVKDIYGKHQ
ncbi:MAG: phBC6A51 family helix-turn-helix protein [Candidatus Taylorbacteria bacterium]|nr:phBC6A51 family helix-turn-helix protein [Candidatus Taylorbacteria bacterium]